MNKLKVEENMHMCDIILFKINERIKHFVIYKKIKLINKYFEKYKFYLYPRNLFGFILVYIFAEIVGFFGLIYCIFEIIKTVISGFLECFGEKDFFKF
jgi:hypothetical protein